MSTLWSLLSTACYNIKVCCMMHDISFLSNVVFGKFITAPAHTHATDAVAYTALFSLHLSFPPVDKPSVRYIAYIGLIKIVFILRSTTECALGAR